MSGVELAAIVTLLVAAVGMAVSLATTFAPVRYEAYLARWSYFSRGTLHMRVGHAVRVLRVMTVAVIWAIVVPPVVLLAAPSLLESAPVQEYPAWLIPVVQVWIAGLAVLAVLTTVVARTGRPQALVIPQVRGLTLDEAERWVRDTVRLPAAWEAHLRGGRRR